MQPLALFSRLARALATEHMVETTEARPPNVRAGGGKVRANGRAAQQASDTSIHKIAGSWHKPLEEQGLQGSMQSTTPPCVRAVLWLAAYNVGELQPQ